MSIKHQVDINNTETVKAKLNHEREDKIQGVIINLYYTDNGIFNISKFMEELLKKQQKIRFSGGQHLTSKWGSRARYQDSGQYGNCHIEASLYGMSQGNLIH